MAYVYPACAVQFVLLLLVLVVKIGFQFTELHPLSQAASSCAFLLQPTTCRWWMSTSQLTLCNNPTYGTEAMVDVLYSAGGGSLSRSRAHRGLWNNCCSPASQQERIHWGRQALAVCGARVQSTHLMYSVWSTCTVNTLDVQCVEHVYGQQAHLYSVWSMCTVNKHTCIVCGACVQSTNTCIVCGARVQSTSTLV